MAKANSQSEAIVLLESLEISTTSGDEIVTKRINLCAGDLSRIPESWGVDILLISAFRGDYTPTPSSVVGALKKVGINVRQVAANKEEDLRKSFHCWYSKPLAEISVKAPFKRLMCFENTSVNVAKDVATLFRGLSTISTLGNDLKVASSLLKTGDSGNNRMKMLRAMTIGCANWMAIGMPITELNIVLYHNGSGPPPQMQYKTLIEQFAKLKADISELMKKEQLKQSFEYDLYLTYSPNEKNVADDFFAVCNSHASSLRVHTEREPLKRDSPWQEEICQKIKKSFKVVHFLSSLFVGADDCIEQFNISYYLNSKQNGRALLAPLLLDSSSNLPNYMKSIQWIDCSRGDREIIADAANQIFQLVTSKTKMPREMASERAGIDVFISYAHKDSETMQKFRSYLLLQNPNLGLFVDSDKLSTGHSWQQTLYESVEASAIVICLLSEDYFNSAVCREEFHLALAANLAQPARKTLIPVLLDSVYQIPAEYSEITPLMMTDKFSSFEEMTEAICNETIKTLEHQSLKQSKLFSDAQKFKLSGSLGERLEKQRSNFLKKSIREIKEQIENLMSWHTLTTDLKTIAIIHHEKDGTEVDAIKQLIQKMCSTPVEVIAQRDVSEAAFLPVIDRAESCVILVSSSFVSDDQCMSNLNLALLDARMTEEEQVLAVMLDRVTECIYPTLVCNKFVYGDEAWEEMEIPGLDSGRDKCLAVMTYCVLKRLESKPLLPDNRCSMLVNPLAGGQ